MILFSNDFVLAQTIKIKNKIIEIVQNLTEINYLDFN